MKILGMSCGNFKENFLKYQMKFQKQFLTISGLKNIENEPTKFCVKCKEDMEKCSKILWNI